MAGWATKLRGSTVRPSLPYIPGAEFHAYTVKEPVGVVVPWNFRLLMAAWKIGPALATGCTIILKPAEQTPLSALRLGELALEAGIPAGVLNVITGYGGRRGRRASRRRQGRLHGSTEVGKLIAQAAGRTNLKRVSLELGGKSPDITLDGADVEAAIAGSAQGIFFNQGEVCTAAWHRRGRPRRHQRQRDPGPGLLRAAHGARRCHPRHARGDLRPGRGRVAVRLRR
jgi:phenylacetaldehyde dehydrogenase